MCRLKAELIVQQPAGQQAGFTGAAPQPQPRVAAPHVLRGAELMHHNKLSPAYIRHCALVAQCGVPNVSLELPWTGGLIDL